MLSNNVKYIGLDVHKEAIAIAVLNGAGKLVMESIVETKASTLLDFLHGLRGGLHVTLEEGTWAAWLYDVLKPHVAEIVVCNPRRNALLKEGSKSDKIDARKLAELLRGGRGERATPGEFRRTQNWIGPKGASLKQAIFVPPPVPEMKEALYALEQFLYTEPAPPLLILAGLAHAQFESIHPYLDGNGRVGRLLITFLLVHGGALRAPLLYLSYYLKLHRAEYYDRLMAIRTNGDWEGWLRFFLRGVAETAQEAADTAEHIFELRETHRTLALAETGTNGLKLLSLLFQRPLVNVNLVTHELDVTFPTANRLVGRFEELGLLTETTGQRRSRVFRYEPYLRLFDEPHETEDQRIIEVTDSAE